MKIKQDPVTKLWCREDGAVLMPPTGRQYKTFRWTFGSKTPQGYCHIMYQGKFHQVHRLICRAFHGLPPTDKPLVDHADRCKVNNKPSNLRWVDRKENADNCAYVDQAVEKYGVRHCEDKAAYLKIYSKAYYEAHREKYKACRAKKKAQGFAQRR